MKKLLTFAGLVLISALPVVSYAWSGQAVAPVAPVAPSDPVTPVADTWGVDAAHTEINFSVTHFFTPVNGKFDDFEVNLDYDADNPANSSVSARIAVASVNTGNQGRDDHLRNPDFFAAEEFPYITFESRSIEVKGEGNLVARGPLTIRGTTHEIELPIKLLGVQTVPSEMRDMFGGANAVASFAARTTIDRGDYGVGTGSWAATLVIGGEVEIEILLEAHRK